MPINIGRNKEGGMPINIGRNKEGEMPINIGRNKEDAHKHRRRGGGGAHKLSKYKRVWVNSLYVTSKVKDFAKQDGWADE